MQCMYIQFLISSRNVNNDFQDIVVTDIG